MDKYGPRFQIDQNRAAQEMTVEKYAENKIKMLAQDFKLGISSEEYFHFRELKTKEAIDAFARKIIMEKL